MDGFAGDGPMGGGDAGPFHLFGAGADEGVPLWQGPFFEDAAVSAGLGKPAEFRHGVGRQLDAGAVDMGSGFVNPAAAGFQIEVFTRHGGDVDGAGIGIFEFLHAAEATAIAQGFPLGFAHA